MRWTSVAMIAFALAFTFALSPAKANPKDEVAAVVDEWSRAFSDHDVDRIVKLYSKDALLWGTNAFSLRTSPEEIAAFYKGAFALPNLTVSFDNQTSRIFGNVAIVAGNYPFTAGKEDVKQDRPSRYSFTFIKEGERWLIVDHNSAPLPTPPVRSQRTHRPPPTMGTPKYAAINALI